MLLFYFIFNFKTIKKQDFCEEVQDCIVIGSQTGRVTKASRKAASVEGESRNIHPIYGVAPYNGSDDNGIDITDYRFLFAGTVMWLGWSVMRIILVVDDMYPETWTLLNQPGLNDGNSTNFWIDAEVIPLQSSEEALPSSIYSFDQMKAAASSTDSQDIKLLFMGSALFFLALSVLCYMNRSYLIQLMHQNHFHLKRSKAVIFNENSCHSFSLFSFGNSYFFSQFEIDYVI